MKYSEFKSFILKSEILTEEQKNDYLSRAILYSPETWKKIVDVISDGEKNIINISKDKKYNKQAVLLEKMKLINEEAKIEREKELEDIEKELNNSLKQF